MTGPAAYGVDVIADRRESEAPFIDVSRVSRSFAAHGGTRHVLRDVSLTLRRGEFVSILGAMGTGKSTLLGIMAGLLAPDAGQVVIDGEPVRGVRADAAVVFQNYSLLPWFTALENVRLAVEAACPQLSRADQRERAQRALRRVGLGAATNRRPGQLSGGMRQRVALARAFAAGPCILLLDEPFGALDALTRDALQQDLAGWCAGGDPPVTVVMVTSNIDEAILLSDRIVPIVPGPPATLGTGITIDLRRPRTAAALVDDHEAARVRTDVIASLTAPGARQPRRTEPS